MGHTFYKSLEITNHQYLLCDLHVHSIASFDVLEGTRFTDLSQEEIEILKKYINNYEELKNEYNKYDSEISEKVPAEDYLEIIEKRRDELASLYNIAHGGRDWSLIAITDHNVCKFACKLSKYAWEKRNEKRIIILPGLELDVEFEVNEEYGYTRAHICVIYPPCTEDEQVHTSINQALHMQEKSAIWNYGEVVKVKKLDAFISSLRNNQSIPAICIAAHISSPRGVRGATLKVLTGLEAEYSRLSAEYKIMQDNNDKFLETISGRQFKEKIEYLQKNIEEKEVPNISVLKLIGQCGFDALQVTNKNDDVHYRCLHRYKDSLGRAVSVLCSDAHCVKDIFSCGENYVPYIKYPQFKCSVEPIRIFRYLKEYTLRFGETRFSSVPANTHTCYIKGIEIKPESKMAKEFWPYEGADNVFRISFSPNLNCLIGGRGSGKSAMIEALAFILEPYKYTKETSKLDWYKRAFQTLSGCEVKICWTSTESNFSHINKKSIFVNRYFDVDHKYEGVEFRDIDGERIVDNLITSNCHVQIYRMSDLESLAIDDEKMRRLFDDICGVKIDIINEKIDLILKELKWQKKEVITLLQQMAELTKDNSPLRTYVIRKKQYDNVNTPEINEKYESLDQAVKARMIALDINSKWEDLLSQTDIGRIVRNINTYFTVLNNKTKDEKGEIYPYTTNLRNVFLKPDMGGEKSLKDTIDEQIGLLNTSFATASAGLKLVQQETVEMEGKEKDALIQQGFPGGGKEREARKRAYDQAANALESYKHTLDILSEEQKKRNRKFQQMKRLARLRTALRSQTAAKITEELRRNLDSSIIEIEADAQPIADKKDYKMWLERTLFPSNTTAKSARVERVLEKQIFPEDMKRILVGDSEETVLTNGILSVADGRINLEDAKRYVEHARIRRHCKYDEDIISADVDASEMPTEIQRGIWVYEEDTRKYERYLELDEIVFDDVPEIRLKDRPAEMEKARSITELSPGQRCSAILPIILLNGTMPLIIDQPEDNLDNRLIKEVVVKILAAMKLRRQVIIATHNANLPVLGDVEQAIILKAVEQDKCSLHAYGDIDEKNVVSSITEIMEGGREAFQYRHSIYQTHWDGPIEASSDDV